MSERGAASDREVSLLVADVGGTHARFATAHLDESGVRLESELTLESQAFPTLADVVAAYLEHRPEARPLRRASLALAGPIENGRCHLTNLNWIVEADDVARAAGLDEVRFVNDLEAAATGIALLPPERLEMLQPGHSRPTANRVVLAPGTGFGEALLIWDGERHRAIASEGGHADFAPANELQVELWLHVAESCDHVSLEDLLSGPGLVNVHRFLTQRRGAAEPEWLAREDAAATIAAEARADAEGLCAASVALFCDLLGAEAGNMALRVLATGGVYFTGGVVRHLLPEIRRSSLLQAFAAKGRHAELLRTVPVTVVLDDRVGLLGAARLGAEPSR